jgi:hypothetical protein
MKLGQKKLHKYALGVKRGVHNGAKFGSKALDVAQNIALVAQPELLPEIEGVKMAVNTLEKITK